LSYAGKIMGIQKRGSSLLIKNVLFVFALVVALTFAAAVPARAGTLYWNVSGTGITGSGTLTTTYGGSPGVFNVTGMTGTFTDNLDSINGVVGDPYPAPGGVVLSPYSIFDYDQILYLPHSGQPLLLDSAGGLLFDVPDGSSAEYAEVNISGIGSGYELWVAPDPASGSYYPPGWPGNPGYSVQFDVSCQTPEPGTWMLILSGGLLILIPRVLRRAR
jgi:hypothetical protein